ncbi:MAG: ferritin-like domain-containing protein [Longimicrobiaceae bacterium]
MKMENLRDLFVHELKDLHDAENQVLNALPKMIEKTSQRELKTAFEEHLDQNRTHLERIERVLAAMGEDGGGQKCKAMAGIMAEGESLMKDAGNPDVRDAALIAAAQKVEHYEIATYGCLKTYASMIDHPEANELLEVTLAEEKEADRRLTGIAEGLVNREAQRAAG